VTHYRDDGIEEAFTFTNDAPAEWYRWALNIGPCMACKGVPPYRCGLCIGEAGRRLAEEVRERAAKIGCLYCNAPACTFDGRVHHGPFKGTKHCNALKIRAMPLTPGKT
jgi:hypothetical protein